MPPTTRIPSRLVFHLSGTGWWQDATAEGDADRVALREAINAAPTNADGSTSLRLSPSWLATLRRAADNLAAVARDDSGYDADARADLNSARAFLRRTA